MININGKNFYNMTGEVIRLWNSRAKRYEEIPSDGFLEVSYTENFGCRWVKDGGISIMEHADRKATAVDPILDYDGDVIVTVEYFNACRDLGVPTSGLFTLGRPIMGDYQSNTIEGYGYLIKG